MTDAEWQPIETAPKDGTQILGFVRTPIHHEMKDGWVDWHNVIHWSGTNWLSEDGIGMGPTHWMPLPEPPHDGR